MRPRQEYDTTTNRSVYNKLRKQILDKDGEIRCSHCGYHDGENDDKKWYGTKLSFDHGFPNKRSRRLRRPSWKLATKNRKQWMPKENVWVEDDPRPFFGDVWSEVKWI